MFQLVAAGALSSAVVPIVSALLATNETARAWRVVSTIANLMLLALLVLAIVVLVAAPVIIPAITPGFTPRPVVADRRPDADHDPQPHLPRPRLARVRACSTRVGRFAASAIAPIVYNLAIIGAAVLLVPSLGVTALAIGVVAGSLPTSSSSCRRCARSGSGTTVTSTSPIRTPARR